MLGVYMYFFTNYITHSLSRSRRFNKGIHNSKEMQQPVSVSTRSIYLDSFCYRFWFSRDFTVPTMTMAASM